jgi:hypothetical protein
MRRLVLPLLAAALAVSLHGASAHAETGPVIVVPGRPGVPVIVNGVDVSGAVVYGDWGLARPGHGEIVIQGPVSYVAPWSVGSYFPSTGRAPAYGRQEIEPPVRRRPDNSYSRTWSAEPDMSSRPVTEYPPFNPPPVIVAPRAAHPRRGAN